MKIVIFSDTHLTRRFDQRKFLFLKTIITKADKVIIAGDFWEGFSISFDEFVKSQWKNLFPYLKRKHTIYLYGNHDKKQICDSRVSLFSIKQFEQYFFTSGGKRFVVQHGNQFVLPINILGSISRLGYSLTHRYIFFHIFSHIQKLTINLFGINFFRMTLHFLNVKIKKQMAISKNSILICGHTHVAENDEENNFVNTGIIGHGIGQYVLIVNGKIYFKDERY